ncbi:MAG: ADP-glyceromanno-heptose 6-epimerase [Verrucomicrobiota bacterium]|nr:ADP-glyceromanno-heptose 6-epimerase [Verrucomicrobiota bacterium]
MIIVTGGAGFIGSALVWRLNQEGVENILIVDHLGETEKWKNLRALNFADYVEKDLFMNMITSDIEGEDVFDDEIEAVFHLGACSSTTEKDATYLIKNNFEYSKHLAMFVLEHDARFIYASSAATYGDGSLGYNDDEETLETLRPLNMYGYSKQIFDLWAKRNGLLDEIVGLKFSNVYGPNEAHKNDMRSVIHKACGQINESGKVNLFKSHKKEYADGEQKRDFVYVKDAVDMAYFFYKHPDINGIFNVGTGKARTWNDLVKAVFDAMGKKCNIEYIDMPESLREKYQYFTKSNMKKICEAGYSAPFSSIEDGIQDYVCNYIQKNNFLGDEE